ncbi:MAG: SGNH/GDSL hydrolase family protein [Elusimicrobia bacterium]|nr:SGNH/GDSL hydrolase family protein [Elusimicrobiota bacterium]
MRALYILAFLITAAAVLIGTEMLLYSQNTLLRNGAWLSTKRTLEVTTWGSDSFLITRPALSRNRLDLGAWSGGNELISRESFTPRRISLRLRLDPDAYLAVLFDRTASGFLAVRLSRKPDYPNAFLRGRPEGRILSAEPLAWPLLDGAWHRLVLDFGAGGLSVSLDAQAPIALPQAAAAAGACGLRSGMRSAVVDDIVVEDVQGRVLRESFRNTKHWPRILLCNCLLVLVLFACLRGRVHAFAACSLVLAVCGSLWLTFDYFHWSRLELDVLSRPLSGAARRSALERAEAARYAFFAGWDRLMGGEVATREALLAQGYAAVTTGVGPIFCGRGPGERPMQLQPGPGLEELFSAKKTAYRILFVGTSQAVGAGAPRLADTFPFLTHAALVKALGPSRPIETLNMAVSGSDSVALLDDYRRLYSRFRPDLVVLDLSSNDRPEQLASGIEGFLSLNKAAGIRSILLKEANSNESPYPDGLLRKHRLLDEAARRYSVPVYDLHGFLNAPAVFQTGWLWWDQVHLTPYGQELAAEWLAPKLRAEAISYRRK